MSHIPFQCLCLLWHICSSIHRLGKCSGFKQQDQATITDLEKKLKSESDIRARVELEVREYQHSSRNSYSAEEVRLLQDKLRKVEKDLESTRKELIRKDKSCEELRKELTSQRKAFRSIDAEKQQLNISLADETRVKIELFTALSEAGRKQQGLVDECHRKNLEIGQLRQNLAEIMAIIPTHPHPTHPSTPHPTTAAALGYPPASSPQH